MTLIYGKHSHISTFCPQEPEEIAFSALLHRRKRRKYPRMWAVILIHFNNLLFNKYLIIF